MKTKMKPAIVVLALTMSVCLLFSVAARAQEGQQCTPDPVDMFISYGADILCAIDQPGTADLFRFDGTAGERIIIETLGAGLPCIELVGVTSACADDSHRNWIDTVLSTTQEYTIRVYDQDNGTGAYTLYLERTVPHSPNAKQINYDQNLPDTFALSGDLDEFFFTASAGDLVDLKTVGGTNYPCITLYAPDAKTTWSACADDNVSQEVRTSALTLAGVYTILVYEQDGSVGDYRVFPQCITGPCVLQTIPDVSGYITLKGAPLSGRGVSLTQKGAPGPQLATTDNNGYYQFLHIISGQAFNVFISGPASSDDGSVDKVDRGPSQ